MNIKKFFGLQTQTEKIKEYREALKELASIEREIDNLGEVYSIQKAQYDELCTSTDLDSKLAASNRYQEFIKSHVSDIERLRLKKMKCEKSIETLERDEEIGEVCEEMREINEIRQRCRKGELSKSIYFDLLKAKGGKTRFADVLVFRGDKLLILQRSDNGSYTDSWCIPGGHVDPGETFIEAARRELQEETGIDLLESNLVEVAVYDNKDVEIHYFMTSIDTDSPTNVIVDGMEEIGSAWIDPVTELKDYKFIFDMKDNLERILGINQEDRVVQVLKAFSSGRINQKMLNDWMAENKDEVRKSKNKSYFSHKERKDLAEKGEAMPNGKYPIRNSQDLKDAVRLVGASDMPKNEVKAWIKKRAKELGLESELPENWIEKAEGVEDTQTLSEEDLDEKPKGPQGSGIEDGGEEEKIEKATEEAIGFGLNLKFNDLEEAQMFKSIVEQWNNEGKINLHSIEEVAPIIEKSKDPMYEAFLDYANFLEGVKTRTKNVHWDETDNSKHVYLDELSEQLSEYEDKIMEAGQSEFGRFKEGTVTGEEIDVNDPVGLVDLIIERTKSFYEKIGDNDNYVGEKSWTEDFLATLKQTKYRLQMH